MGTGEANLWDGSLHEFGEYSAEVPAEGLRPEIHIMRKIMKRLSISAIMLAAITVAPQVWSQGGSATFPEVETSNLEGRKYSLPRDFESERNLVLIAFEREQQKDVDTWLHESTRFEQFDPALRIYELPTIARLDPFRRWFIDTGMRHGIPGRKARERTLTLYLDKNSFRQSLKIESEKQIYAMLVDRSGDVLWRSDGDFAETKAQSLKEALLKLQREK